MSDYTKATNFTLKDGLTTGDPGKIIKGSEIDAEYTSISNAIASKADLNSPTFTGTPAGPTPVPSTDSSGKLATTAFVQSALEGAYPVGSIYMNATVATNPATLLGFGTWVAFGAGKVPVGIDTGDTDFDTIGETGGSKTNSVSVTTSGTSGSTALTEAQMPKHYHKMRGPTFITGYPQGSSGSSGIYFGGSPDDSGHLYGTYSTGGGATSAGYETGTGNGDGHTHSISSSGTGTADVVQPYIVVYMWKRTA
jgi:hypothetical protein